MLKGFYKKYKGASFTHKIKELIWELKYAWQRAWRGYDSVDVYNLNDNFINKMILILKDFRKYSIRVFIDDRGVLSEEETNKIIDDMIYCFENSDADKLLDPIYGEFNETTGVFENSPNIDQIIAFENIAKQNRQKAMELFTKYFDCLWY